MITQRQVLICTSGNENLWLSLWVIWKTLLLALGLFLAWETRHVSFPSLNDSKYIGMSVYNVVIMSLINVPLYYVVGEAHIQARYALIATTLNFISTFTLLVLFVPKVSIKYRSNEIVWWCSLTTGPEGNFGLNQTFFEGRGGGGGEGLKCIRPN